MLIYATTFYSYGTWYTVIMCSFSFKLKHSTLNCLNAKWKDVDLFNTTLFSVTSSRIC